MLVMQQKLSGDIEAIINNLPVDGSQAYFEEMERMEQISKNKIETMPDALLCSLFLNAIKEHYRPSNFVNEHIYLQQFEIPQIKLFDILINKFPFVVSAHAISNSLICRWLQGQASAVVIDIGIGRGIQMAALINELAGNEALRELTIIGIEPFADAIEHAKTLIDAAARRAPFRVKLHILKGFAETIEPAEIETLLPADYTRLIINGSLAVHHVPNYELRKHFFEQVKRLQPYAMVLTEPHSDHMIDDWQQRVKNAWVHYGAKLKVFSVHL